MKEEFLLSDLRHKSLDSLDFRLLAEYVTHKNALELLIEPHQKISPEEFSLLQSLIERRLFGEPVAYLTGHKEFFGRKFFVTKDTLIPRPDSECLLEDIFSTIEKTHASGGSFFDIGTGSGALAISLSLHLPKTFRVFASDVSIPALEIAKKNQEVLEARVSFFEGPFLQAYPAEIFSHPPLFFVANLPYVSAKLLAESPRDVQNYEPHLALLSDDEGLSHYKTLLQEFSDLKLSGTIWLEISPEQSTLLTDFIKNLFPKADIFVGQDLAGRDRFVRIHILST